MTGAVLGPTIVLVIVGLIALGLVVWAVVDVARRPWRPMAKVAWIAGLVVGAWFGVGVILAIL